MTFRVGQKVVCVDALIPPNRVDLHFAPLVEGRVYTIRAVYSYGRPGVLLEEITSVVRSDNMEFGYYASRFRPVVERKTDAGFAILEEIRKRESVPANERVRALSSQECPR